MNPNADLLNLREKVALVTGGGMGIGEAIALRLAGAGAAVAVGDVNASAGNAVARRIVEEGGRAMFVQMDVADLAQHRSAVDAVTHGFGGLDLLVNNAGVFPFSPAVDTTPELWDRVLSINLRGAFFLTTAAARYLRSSGTGAVVNVASVDAFRPTGGHAHNDASKAALVMLTRSLAVEFAPLKIRVNAVVPGGIDTPGARSAMGGSVPLASNLAEAFLQRIPMHRMGTPDEIARVALFLATPLSAYMTGALVVVDGGYLVA
ncbi:MAG: SDR family oxidoreductase [Thermoplasmata archaeon]|nr:SDR family oxidoreductase [Thermoplasmata archaeon]